MSGMSFTVNGKTVTAEAPARTHLADFLRETMCLTGTHIGCEHGVCGACTLLIDGEPARACITFAPACAGHEIQTIEGLEHDPIIAALRAEFSAHHALQCGYCTPGMLVTARDIIRRLPNADDDRIRIELAGNLCRCTGYNGIVAAIRAVLNNPPDFHARTTTKLNLAAPPAIAAAAPRLTVQKPSGTGLTQKLDFAVPQEELWAALQDPALIAACIPGASLTSMTGTHVTGAMSVAFGPIKGNFTGAAELTYGDYVGEIIGEGQDKISKTRLTATVDFNVIALSAAASRLSLTITYSLRGALAQFARAAVVAAFADEIAAIVGANLQARLTGTPPVRQRALNPVRLMANVMWRRIKKLFTRAV